MEQRAHRIPLGDTGTVTAIVAVPDGAVAGSTPAVVLAHGAGNDMHAPFLSAVHEGVAAHGFVAVKFNFPYKERGARVPDPPPVLERCYASVLDCVRDLPDLRPPRVVIGGKSLGGRMASHLAAAGADVAGLLFLGYPLHPAAKPDQLRVAHLERIRVPMLFIAGSRDPLCRLDLLRATIERLHAPVTLHVVEGGDHSFALPRRARRVASAVWDEIIAVSVQWLHVVAG